MAWPASVSVMRLPRAHEQLLAEPGFQIADLLADRRRGHAKLARGQGEAAGPGGDLEGLDRVQRRQPFHGGLHKFFLVNPNNFPR